MATRSAQARAAARRARLAIEAAERRTARRRRVRNAVLVAVASAIAVVVLAIASSGGGTGATAAGGGRVVDAAFSRALLAGIPQHGLVLGRPGAPVRIVEFADLQCPYCGEFATRALPQLIPQYVRTGKVDVEFRNLSFIGPDSVSAGLAAAGAEEQNRLWNLVDLMYLNQGEENTGYVTNAYLHRLLAAVPGLSVVRALQASRAPQATAMLAAANQAAVASGINSTPSFLIGRAGGQLRLFAPTSLTAGAFVGELNGLLGPSS